MWRFGSAAGLVPLVLVIACSPAPRSGPDDKKAIPEDFRVYAKYAPGLSRWKSWDTTITADGKVVQEFQGSTKDSRLSEKDLHDLLKKIEEAEFFTLKERYEAGGYDFPTLYLTVYRNKKHADVSVDGAGFLKNDKEVKRFLQIWTELLRKVPSPNPDDKPELYQP